MKLIWYLFFLVCPFVLSQHAPSDVCAYPRWSPDGSTIVYNAYEKTGQYGHIWIADVESGTSRKISPENLWAMSPSFSPDGQHIVFAVNPKGGFQDPDSHIYIMKSDGSDLRKLIDRPGKHIMPGFSPDGKSIAFSAKLKSEFRIYTMNLKTAKTRIVTSHDYHSFHPTWMPDGSMIFDFNTGQASHIHQMNLDGSGLTQLTPMDHPGFNGRLSPNGDFLAYVSNRDNQSDIYLLNLSTKIAKRLTTSPNQDWQPDWSPDGKRLVYTSRKGEGRRLCIISKNGGTPRFL